MAGVKISNLPAGTVPLTGTEVLPIVQGAVTDKVTVANLTAGRAVSALSLSLTTALPIASGGTNSTAAPTAGALAYGSGTAYAYTAAGTSGQLLTSAGAGTPVWITTLPIANGGTNSTATPTAGGAGYGTGTAHAYTAAGTVGQVLTSQGASAPTWTAAASGAQDYIVQSYGII